MGYSFLIASAQCDANFLKLKLGNYRPVILMSVPGKLVESVIKVGITKHIKEQGLERKKKTTQILEREIMLPPFWNSLKKVYKLCGLG